jgi:hypothetical protein
MTFLKAVNPTALVSKEQSLSGLKIRESDRTLICDIYINRGTHFQIVDICVANPTCLSSLQVGSSTNQLSAAIGKERAKKNLYRRCINSTAFSNFVPFVLESTGALGPAAKKFLDEVCGFGSLSLDPETMKNKRIQLLKTFSSILVRANAQLVRHGRSAGLTLSLS